MPKTKIAAPSAKIQTNGALKELVSATVKPGRKHHLSDELKKEVVDNFIESFENPTVAPVKKQNNSLATAKAIQN